MTTAKPFLTKSRRPAATAARTAAVVAAAVTLSACTNGLEPGGHVAGWTSISHAQRHPIIVSEQPANMSLRVARGADGLNPHQRATLVDFLGKYRGGDSSNGRLTIQVPSGSPNEVAALKAVADLRQLASDYGVDETRIAISPYHTERDPQPPIRISYTRFVAEGPECGSWPANLADDSRNLPYANFGCSTQRNFAAQVANPADLLGPRTMTPASAERRDVKWEKFNRGETVISKKDAEEKASVKSEN